MKYSSIRNTVLAMAIVAALAASLSITKASITCSSWQPGNASGSQGFSCNFYSGITGGDYNNSYTCNNVNLSQGYCSIDYKGGNTCQGAYSVECVDYYGRSYNCDLNWNGVDGIYCEYLPKNCKEVLILCKTGTAVPEPSTIVAGVLLLLPFGISTARILRKNKQA